MEITAKSYFSGAGGMDLGIEEAGINILELTRSVVILCRK